MLRFSYTVHGRIWQTATDGSEAGRPIIFGGCVEAEDRYEAETLGLIAAVAATDREYPGFRFQPTTHVQAIKCSDQGFKS